LVTAALPASEVVVPVMVISVPSTLVKTSLEPFPKSLLGFIIPFTGMPTSTRATTRPYGFNPFSSVWGVIPISIIAAPALKSVYVVCPIAVMVEQNKTTASDT